MEVWYRQNMLCFVADERVKLIRQSISAGQAASDPPRDVVHPQSYLRVVRENEQWRRYSKGLEERNFRLKSELMKIKNSKAWRVYEAVRPAIRAAKRIHGHLRVQDADQGPDRRTAAFERLLVQSPSFHAWADGSPANWSIAPDALRFLHDSLVPGMRTLETGSGQTTVVFAIAGTHHTCITPDLNKSDRIRAYCAQHGIPNTITFIHESSDVALPAGRGIPEHSTRPDRRRPPLPFPILDWHYTERPLPVAAWSRSTIYPMPSVRILYDFLVGEEEWELIRSSSGTAFFPRDARPSTSGTGPTRSGTSPHAKPPRPTGRDGSEDCGPPGAVKDGRRA